MTQAVAICAMLTPFFFAISSTLNDTVDVNMGHVIIMSNWGGLLPVDDLFRAIFIKTKCPEKES